MDRKLLEEPFPPSLVKSRQGAFGNRLSYVPVEHYVRKLNSAFEGAWSFEIIKHEVLETEVVVVGKLVAGGVIKMAFGGSKITYSRGSGEIVSIADDLKAASSDCLKRASRLLGVGLDLYSDTQPAAESGNGRKARGNGNGQHRGNGGKGNQRPTNGAAATAKQISTVWMLGRQLGLNADQIRAKSMENFNAMPEHLSKTDASSFISALGAELSGDGGAA